MKKLITILAAVVVCVSYTGCSETDDLWGAYDDLNDRVSALEQSVAAANSDIDALQKLVQALQQKVTIDAVTPTDKGYTIKFSDGTTAEISNGTSAPAISVRQDTDGFFYWTLDGEWMLAADGSRVRASASDGQKGDKGENGKDGITPRIRINDQTKEWEYSVDDGKTWQSTGVVAEGKDGIGGSNGDAFFKSVDTSDDDVVVFTLADGTSFAIARTVDFKFEIECDGTNWFAPGETKVFAVAASRVEDYMVSQPGGWQVSFDGAELTVTAPAAGDADGEIAFVVVSTAGTSKIVRMTVRMMRVLTFEDADYKGTQAGYWTSLIDSKEYGGPLLYGDYDYCDYEWSDDGNTYLSSGIVETYGMKVFWNGGCAVSNYTLTDITQGSFMTQLSVPVPADGKVGKGGHNGSDNFGICFVGTSNDSSASLTFADGKARTIDHMYIAVTAYTLNSLKYGDGFSQPAGPDGWFAVTATGFDADDKQTGEVTIFLCKDGKIVDGWNRWDLSPLGEVVRAGFSCSGSDTGAWGLNTPSYFAFDDVAVRAE